MTEENENFPVILSKIYSVQFSTDVNKLPELIKRNFDLYDLKGFYHRLLELGSYLDKKDSESYDLEAISTDFLNLLKRSSDPMEPLPDFLQKNSKKLKASRNDFIVVKKNREIKTEDKLLYELSYYIGQGRLILFKENLSNKMMNFVVESLKFQSNLGTQYLIVPWINFIRTEKIMKLEGVLSFSFVIIPVDSNFSKRRDTNPYEIYDFSRGNIEGTLIIFDQEIKGIKSNEIYEIWIRKFLKSIDKKFIDNLGQNGLEYSRHVILAIDRSIDFDAIVSYFKYKEKQTLNKLEDSLYKFIYQEGYLINKRLPKTVDFSKLLIVPDYYFDLDHLSLYDPNEGNIVEIMPREREQLNSWSIKWGFIWDNYEAMGLTNLEVKIDKAFKLIDESNRTIKLMINKLSLMKSIEEFYDLSLSFPLYKLEYSKLKKISKIEDDYRILREKFDSVKEDVLAISEHRLALMGAYISVLLVLDTVFPQWFFISNKYKCIYLSVVIILFLVIIFSDKIESYFDSIWSKFKKQFI